MLNKSYHAPQPANKKIEKIGKITYLLLILVFIFVGLYA